MREDTKACSFCKKQVPLSMYYVRATGQIDAQCRECSRNRIRALALNRKTRKSAMESREIDSKLCKRFLRSHVIKPTLWDMTL